MKIILTFLYIIFISLNANAIGRFTDEDLSGKTIVCASYDKEKDYVYVEAWWFFSDLEVMHYYMKDVDVFDTSKMWYHTSISLIDILFKDSMQIVMRISRETLDVLVPKTQNKFHEGSTCAVENLDGNAAISKHQDRVTREFKSKNKI